MMEGVRFEDMALSDIVTLVSSIIDIATSGNSKGKRLILVGGNTPFLNAIRKKATKLGIQCTDQMGIEVDSKTPVVFDTEVEAPQFLFPREADVDEIVHNGTSCCAQAIFDLFANAKKFNGENVTIIGRGHAVQGLAEALNSFLDCTVTVCHSKTRSLYDSTLFAKVIVVAAPVKPEDVAPLTGKYVIDLTGAFKGAVDAEHYVGNIGKLTTSILLKRTVEVDSTL